MATKNDQHQPMHHLSEHVLDAPALESGPMATDVSPHRTVDTDHQHHRMTASMLRIEHEHMWFMIVGFAIALFKFLSDSEFFDSRIAQHMWPSCMVLLGFMLVFYREQSHIRSPVMLAEFVGKLGTLDSPSQRIFSKPLLPRPKAVDNLSQHSSKDSAVTLHYWINSEDENYQRELERVTRFGGLRPAPVSSCEVAWAALLSGVQIIAFISWIAGIAVIVLSPQ